jgi:hypothetical protein
MNPRKWAPGIRIGLGLFVVILASSVGHGQVDSPPLVVLMAPTGDDAHDGSTLDTPILSLNRAQEVIRQLVAQTGPRDVQVRIGPGQWTVFQPNYRVGFRNAESSHHIHVSLRRQRATRLQWY